MTEPTVRDQRRASTESIDRLASAASTAVRDIVRRYRLNSAECDALSIWLTQLRADVGRRSALDAVVESVLDDDAPADGRGGDPALGDTVTPDISLPAGAPSGRDHASERILTTVLFTDIVDSTRHAAELGDRKWLQVLERHDELASAQVARAHGHVVRHTGDGIVAIFDSPSRGVQSATALTQLVPELGIDIRCGLHTGECELRGDDIGGIAVHTGARIAALAYGGEILVSHTVKDLVKGSGIAFRDRGTHALKGVPGDWRLFACGQFARRNCKGRPWPAPRCEQTSNAEIGILTLLPKSQAVRARSVGHGA